jgi:hypothetical protein
MRVVVAAVTVVMVMIMTSKNYILLLKSFSTAVLIGGRLLEFSRHLSL